MNVIFTQSVSGPYGAFAPGSEADIEDSLAVKLVQAGFCRAAEVPVRRTADAPPVREVASVGPEKETAKAKPKRTRSKP